MQFALTMKKKRILTNERFDVGQTAEKTKSCASPATAEIYALIPQVDELAHQKGSRPSMVLFLASSTKKVSIEAAADLSVSYGKDTWMSMLREQPLERKFEALLELKYRSG